MMAACNEDERFIEVFKNCFNKIANKLPVSYLNLNNSMPSQSLNSVSSSSTSTKLSHGSRHIISSDSITINKELGVGEFGVVQQGVWTNEDGERIQVAIKCLSSERMENNQLEFLKEAKIMHQLTHEHIVKLYGVVLEPSLMMVTELAPLRSLLECLKETSLRSSFPIISLCNFAYQIADGMSYLEAKRLIHRDLAARNILVFGKNKVKISDFGLSRALGVGKDYYQTNFNVNLKLPIAWCAPECINFLKFTSQSDVWAYGVTLWEMFSYGFQPWAALTGQQILESIDEPSYQRLEQPECCPKEYYSLMLKCWAHDPNSRPKFCEIVQMLPDCKPEQVQCVKESDWSSETNLLSTSLSTTSSLSSTANSKKELLIYKVGDIITVLDKRNQNTLSSSHHHQDNNLWKGALNNGRVGYFKPNHVVAYLGQNLPTSSSSAMTTSTSSSTSSTSKHQTSNFIRGLLDSKNNNSNNNSSSVSSPYSSQRRKLCPEMISRPQGDLKHTGHVGADGAFFGDVSFLGEKYYQLPKQIVNPYHDSPKQSIDLTESQIKFNNKQHGNGQRKLVMQHEYHEISDEEVNPLESPHFDTFDFGPSLMEEVFKELDQIKPELNNDLNEAELAINESGTNVKNEIKEITSKYSKELGSNVGGSTSFSTRKKQAMVKPISASDQQQLDEAIAMAKDIASRSMLGLESDVIDGINHNNDSPKTPTSPNKKKFSFKFGPSLSHKSSPKCERRNFSEETESIGHITESITPAAKIAYNTLVEKGEGLKDDRDDGAANFIDEDENDGNPLRMLRSGGAMGLMRARVRGNRSFSQPRIPTTAQTAGLARNASCSSRSNLGTPPPVPDSNQIEDINNALPLPPRDRSRPLPVLKTHQRRHPLVLPSTSGYVDNNFNSNLNNNQNINIQNNNFRRDSSPAALISTTNKPVLKQVSCPQAPLQFLQSNYTSTLIHHHNNNQNQNQTSSSITTNKDDEKTAPIPPPKPLRTYNKDESDNQLLDDINKELDYQKENEDKKEKAIIHNQNNEPKPESSSSLSTVSSSKHSPESFSYSKKGCHSDEVILMQKVLTNEDLSAEEAAAILSTTDWDVHRAIKCVRLRQQLRNHNINIECDWAKALAKFNWNVRQSTNYLIATHSSADDTTEV